MIFSIPSWNRLCLILGSPRHTKSSQNEVKIDPRAAQTHFRPDCIVCRPCQWKTHFLHPPNHQKSSKIKQKCKQRRSSKKGRPPRSTFTDFWWFWGSTGRAENHQKSKKCLPKIDRKKGRKKEGDLLSFGWGSAAKVQPRESKDSVQEGFCQVRKTNLKHASTPGGVRRI